MISKKILLVPVLVGLATIYAQHAAAQTSNVPVVKIAVIVTDSFMEPQGIAKFTALENQVAAEFKKPQDELSAAAQKIQSLETEIQKLQSSVAPVDPKSVNAKMDQLDQLKKDSQRKLEDTKELYQQRRKALLGPLDEDLRKSLDAFAKAHGITMVIDRSQVPGVIYASDTLDITKAFITEYNAKNPATTATTTKP